MVRQGDAAAGRAGGEQQFTTAEQLELEGIALLKMQQSAEGLGQPHCQQVAPAADLQVDGLGLAGWRRRRGGWVEGVSFSGYPRISAGREWRGSLSGRVAVRLPDTIGAFLGARVVLHDPGAASLSLPIDGLLPPEAPVGIHALPSRAA